MSIGRGAGEVSQGSRAAMCEALSAPVNLHRDPALPGQQCRALIGGYTASPGSHSRPPALSGVGEPKGAKACGFPLGPAALFCVWRGGMLPHVEKARHPGNSLPRVPTVTIKYAEDWEIT